MTHAAITIPTPWMPKRDAAATAPPDPITIGDDVFIGARSVIFKGVTIGDCAVIGADSVVT